MILAFLIITMIIFGLNLTFNLFLLNNSINQDTPKTSTIIALAITLILLTWNIYCIIVW